MIDLKGLNAALSEMEEDRGLDRGRLIEAIEQALATAYKKEYGKRGQIVRAVFDIASGTTAFEQIKVVVDESMLKAEDEEDDPEEEQAELEEGEIRKVRFDAEKHIMIANAKLIKKDVELNEELVFPLETKDDFGRIAAQTAKQVIIQKIREAEKDAALTEFGQKEGDIVMGHVQRFERGNLYVDLGRVTATMPYDEQIPGERYRPGERVRALLVAVDETPRGIFLKISRSHPDFLEALFTVEAPELQNGTVEVKAIAREAGARSKIAVFAHDSHIDPVGSLVGQRGVRVSTVMSELGGEKIDIIEWSEEPSEFIEDALSPAQVMEVAIEAEPDEENDERGHAVVEVAPDQQSLAIGRGGQNVRLAAKLTGWKIDIHSVGGDELAESDGDEVDVSPDTEVGEDLDTLENEEGTTTKEAAPETDDEATEDRDLVDEDQTEEINEVDTPEEAEALVNEEADDSEAVAASDAGITAENESDESEEEKSK